MTLDSHSAAPSASMARMFLSASDSRQHHHYSVMTVGKVSRSIETETTYVHTRFHVRRVPANS